MDSELVDEFLSHVKSLAADEYCISDSIRDTVVRAIVRDKDFTVTLEDLANWLGRQEAHLKKYLGCYVQDKDFRVEVQASAGRGRPKENIYMTMRCCKQIAMKCRGKRSEQIRSYFILIEQSYREWMGEVLGYRMKNEDPEIWKEKHCPETSNPKDFPKGPGVYVFEVDNKKGKTYKIGKADDLKARYPGLLRDRTTGRLTLRHWEPNCEPLLLEKCAHHLLREHAEPHEIFRTDLPTIVRAIQSCQRGLQAIDNDFVGS